jgi:uncharacterized protein
LIAYFDTSAIVPLLVEEPVSSLAGELWRAADRAIGNRLVYVECRSALASAHRSARLGRVHLRRAVTELEDLFDEFDLVDITDDLVRHAGALAETYGLRGYDAVHLASADLFDEPELVLVAGDGALCDAAEARGLAVARLGPSGTVTR